MSQAASGWWVYFVFISSIICIALELAIFGLAVFVPRAADKAASEDFNLSESEGGLNNNIQTYKTVKMGKKDGDAPGKDEEVNANDEGEM